MKIKLLMLSVIVISLLSCATQETNYLCNHIRVDATSMQNISANCLVLKREIIKEPAHGRSAERVIDRDPEANEADPEIYYYEMIFKIDNSDIVQCDYIKDVLQSCHTKEEVIKLEEFY